MTRYAGLTWSHPRGYTALAAAARRLDEARDGIALTWDTQPLEGFEAHPIADLCARYDLVVLDHPHVGEAVARDCLVPLEDVFEAHDLADWSAVTIGACFASYRWAARHWALPLDAATQVTALRPDLAAEVPVTWDEVLACSERLPVALSLAGPHALLTWSSIAAAFDDERAAPGGAGGPWQSRAGEPGVFSAAGERALDIMAVLHGRMPPAARPLNPIGLLEMMAQTRDVAVCPLVFGYVNYAVAGQGGRALAFHDAPRAATERRPGSTLGGTGIGISRRCRVTPALVDHLRWLLGAEAQLAFIPAHDGQPSRRDAWLDDGVNAAWGGFYRNTAATLEAAIVRPRFDGYVRFQAEASALLRQGLDDRIPHAVLLDRLRGSYERAGGGARQGIAG